MEQPINNLVKDGKLDLVENMEQIEEIYRKDECLFLNNLSIIINNKVTLIIPDDDEKFYLLFRALSPSEKYGSHFATDVFSKFYNVQVITLLLEHKIITRDRIKSLLQYIINTTCCLKYDSFLVGFCLNLLHINNELDESLLNAIFHLSINRKCYFLTKDIWINYKINTQVFKSFETSEKFQIIEDPNLQTTSIRIKYDTDKNYKDYDLLLFKCEVRYNETNILFEPIICDVYAFRSFVIHSRNPVLEGASQCSRGPDFRIMFNLVLSFITENGELNLDEHIKDIYKERSRIINEYNTDIIEVLFTLLLEKGLIINIIFLESDVFFENDYHELSFKFDDLRELICFLLKNKMITSVHLGYMFNRYIYDNMRNPKAIKLVKNFLKLSQMEDIFDEERKEDIMVTIFERAVGYGYYNLVKYLWLNFTVNGKVFDSFNTTYKYEITYKYENDIAITSLHDKKNRSIRLLFKTETIIDCKNDCMTHKKHTLFHNNSEIDHVSRTFLESKCQLCKAYSMVLYACYRNKQICLSCLHKWYGSELMNLHKYNKVNQEYVIPCNIDTKYYFGMEACCSRCRKYDEVNFACGRDKCWIMCNDCLKAWYGAVLPGKLVFPYNLYCPYCKQLPSPDITKIANEKIHELSFENNEKLIDYDPLWHYAWCVECNRIKKYIQKECISADKDLSIENFKCDDCRVDHNDNN